MNEMDTAPPLRRAAARLEWSEEREYWPHAEASSFVHAGGLRWHVQRMGNGPVALLVHGTGASSHSWRTLAPLLAPRFTVIAADLPGHGFTESPPRRRLSLPAMADAVADLVDALGSRPSLAVGHSAGAAILARACIDGRLAPDALVGINAALMPFRGAAGILFPPLAKLLFLNPLTPYLLARSATDRARVRRLIADTGSVLSEVGIDLYARLLTSPRHVSAALGMMANWELRRFERELAALSVPLLLLVADNDRAVPPSDAERVERIVAGTRIERIPDAGHLVHEELPQAVSERILEFTDAVAA